ncbi:lipoprotein insertase outer membrane protein LolB [Shewanella fidelis]|uniref:Outer-membrane lipoprotein LolB n=1 Tax=Shewanella fidelis TaxID=173509 RepID=A0AAW8NJI5_9GAMM|nr:lipoprotein insertase outer membrane protein LolB [Shewanella fidelis]MDR8522826.1 lipoprotein insertase outer membrane protein LolB [Shewanella fidelis]MDW4811848.1 lipoprotein insertase outer membrane protein LolB [Shewanella fidelis]MDW4818128.1 lipoprotein insertase outer membrane protein LolB [Shewanella fidelis]MDW4822195.1 lipoprotein insertase outer membrane protein LolB [Shewanella fidelis]MDW4826412.1 lipoprotein insertase outer membrane protein LolB [Shewanella fidelis]
MNNLSRFTKNTYLWVMLSTIFISGCSTTIPDNLIPVSVNKVQQASAWEMQGKLAVRTSQDRFSTNIYWLHSPHRDELTLTTVLGTTLLSLSSQDGLVTLSVDGETYQDTNAQRLLTRVSGWSIPIDSLPLWLTGQLTAGDKLISSDSQQRPSKLVNSQQLPPWQVEFKSWQKQSGADVPRLLNLTRGDLRLKLQLNKWQALAPENQALIKPISSPENSL